MINVATRQFASSAIYRVLGATLLFAAAAKALPLLDMTYHFGNMPNGFSSLNLLAAWLTPLEVALGLSLASGHPPKIIGVCAVFLFMAFASIGVLEAVGGVGSCGCFGRILLDPYVKAALNAAMVAASAVALRFSTSRDTESKSPALIPHLLGLLAYSVAFSIAYSALYVGANHGGIRTGVVNRTLLAIPQSQFSTIPESDLVSIVVPIKNLTHGTLKIVGGSQNCGFHLAEKWPVDIPSGSVYSVKIESRNPTRSSKVDIHFSLFSVHESMLREHRFAIVAHK